MHESRAERGAAPDYCFWPPDWPPEVPPEDPLLPPLDDFSPPCPPLVLPPVLVPDLLVVLVPDLVSVSVLVEPRTDVSPRVLTKARTVQLEETRLHRHDAYNPTTEIMPCRSEP